MSAGLYPAAQHELIAPGSNDPRILPVMAVLHRSASRATDLHNWFAHGSGGIESHFYIRRDGKIFQYRDCLHEADAQSAGNSWVVGAHRYGAISIETEGTASDTWTAKQLAAIKALLLWLNVEHGIRLRVVPSSQPRSVAAGGVGWHSKYKAWNPNAHACPGTANVHKLKALLHELDSAPVHTPPTPSPVVHPGEDSPMTIVFGPQGARYHLTNGKLIRLDPTVNLGGPISEIHTDQAVFERYKAAFELVK